MRTNKNCNFNNCKLFSDIYCVFSIAQQILISDDRLDDTIIYKVWWCELGKISYCQIKHIHFFFPHLLYISQIVLFCFDESDETKSYVCGRILVAHTYIYLLVFTYLHPDYNDIDILKITDTYYGPLGF